MHRANTLAWESANKVDEFGISVFQTTIESIIEKHLNVADLRLTDRLVEDGDCKHIVANVSGLGLRVWIHSDHMQVTNTVTGEPAFCMEWRDDMVPDDHYAAADEFFRDIVAIHQGTF